MKPFHAVLLGLFVMLAIGSVALFAGFQGRNSQGLGKVVIWGSLPREVVKTQLDELGRGINDYSGASYVEKDPATFIPDLVEAIAASRGPDLVVFPASFLARHADKLADIPYSTLSARAFKDTFIEGGEIFLGVEGFKGFPYLVDPLVMYWNRTLLTTAGIASPPRYWDEVASLAPKLTKSDKNGTLVQSTVALGSWDNVTHAKGIILSILRELGDRVVVADGGALADVFNGGASQGGVSSAASTFRFYTEFANPTKPSYSWNRSQPSSRDAFLAGRLAFYIGRASELYEIRQANPNLNFDIAPVPEARGAGRYTEANLYALVIPRGSKNSNGAVFIARALTGVDGQKILGAITHLPSIRRDLLVVSPDDPYSEIFRTAALSAFAFLDPDPAATEALFKRAIDNISSGKLEVSEAVAAAREELKALLLK